jgi:hypothetical protein
MIAAELTRTSSRLRRRAAARRGAGCVRIAQIGLEQLGAAAGRAHGTGRVLGAFAEPW